MESKPKTVKFKNIDQGSSQAKQKKKPKQDCYHHVPKMTFVQKKLEDLMLDRFQECYDTFFQLIKQRISRLNKRQRQQKYSFLYESSAAESSDSICTDEDFQELKQRSHSSQSLFRRQALIRSKTVAINNENKSQRSKTEDSQSRHKRKQEEDQEFQAKRDVLFDEYKDRFGIHAARQRALAQSEAANDDKSDKLNADYLYLPSHLTQGLEKQVKVAHRTGGDFQNENGDTKKKIDTDFKLLAKKLSTAFEKELLEKSRAMSYIVYELQKWQNEQYKEQNYLLHDDMHPESLEPRFKRLDDNFDPEKLTSAEVEYFKQFCDQMTHNKGMFISQLQISTRQFQQELQEQKDNLKNMKFEPLKSSYKNSNGLLKSQTFKPTKHMEVQPQQSAQYAEQEEYKQQLMTFMHFQNKRENKSQQQLEEKEREIKKLASKIKELEAQVAKLEKFEVQNTLLKTMQQDMRMKFMKELNNYKQSNMDQMKYNVNRTLKDSEKVQVTYFDPADGLDQETMFLVNKKIEEVKLQSESVLANLVSENTRINHELIKYQKLTPKDYQIMEMSKEEIFECLNIVIPDPQDIWDQSLAVYGQECFTPMIVRKFADEFKGDYDRLNKQFKQLQEDTKEQLNEVREENKILIVKLQRENEALKNDMTIQERKMILEQQRQAKIYYNDGYQKAVQDQKILNGNQLQQYVKDKTDLYRKIMILEEDAKKYKDNEDREKLRNVLIYMTMIGKFKIILEALRSKDSRSIVKAQIDIALDHLGRVLRGETSRKFREEAERLQQEQADLRKEQKDQHEKLCTQQARISALTSRLSICQGRLDQKGQDYTLLQASHARMLEQTEKMRAEYNQLTKNEKLSNELIQSLTEEKNGILVRLQSLAPVLYRKIKGEIFVETELNRKKASVNILQMSLNGIRKVHKTRDIDNSTQTDIKNIKHPLLQTKEPKNGADKQEGLKKNTSMFICETIDNETQTDKINIYSQEQLQKLLDASNEPSQQIIQELKDEMKQLQKQQVVVQYKSGGGADGKRKEFESSTKAVQFKIDNNSPAKKFTPVQQNYDLTVEHQRSYKSSELMKNSEYSKLRREPTLQEEAQERIDSLHKQMVSIDPRHKKYLEEAARDALRPPNIEEQPEVFQRQWHDILDRRAEVDKRKENQNQNQNNNQVYKTSEDNNNNSMLQRHVSLFDLIKKQSGEMVSDTNSKSPNIMGITSCDGISPVTTNKKIIHLKPKYSTNYTSEDEKQYNIQSYLNHQKSFQGPLPQMGQIQEEITAQSKQEPQGNTKASCESMDMNQYIQKQKSIMPKTTMTTANSSHNLNLMNNLYYAGQSTQSNNNITNTQNTKSHAELQTSDSLQNQYIMRPETAMGKKLNNKSFSKIMGIANKRTNSSNMGGRAKSMANMIKLKQTVYKNQQFITETNSSCQNNTTTNIYQQQLTEPPEIEYSSMLYQKVADQRMNVKDNKEQPQNQQQRKTYLHKRKHRKMMLSTDPKNTIKSTKTQSNNIFDTINILDNKQSKKMTFGKDNKHKKPFYTSTQQLNSSSTSLAGAAAAAAARSKQNQPRIDKIYQSYDNGNKALNQYSNANNNKQQSKETSKISLSRESIVELLSANKHSLMKQLYGTTTNTTTIYEDKRSSSQLPPPRTPFDNRNEQDVGLKFA